MSMVSVRERSLCWVARVSMNCIDFVDGMSSVNTLNDKGARTVS